MNYNNEYDFCRNYMVGDEYILWKGKPEKGSLFTAQDLFMIPFSILWCGFAVFWFVSAIASGAPIFFSFFGLPFVAVGLYLIFGRFIHTAYLRKRTFYVVTNKKIIRQRGSKVDTLSINNLPPMTLVAHKNGNGTIRFGQPYSHYDRGFYRGTTYSSHMFSLENIPQAVQVQDIISNAKQ
ncbi:MAG: PH domain-containing protein [Clostridia bacterium]|nr:PH domain-containing protein [Clostridia bacterium]